MAFLFTAFRPHLKQRNETKRNETNPHTGGRGHSRAAAFKVPRTGLPEHRDARHRRGDSVREPGGGASALP